jgi:DNA (cytosine-5)-methyltransferase 1
VAYTEGEQSTTNINREIRNEEQRKLGRSSSPKRINWWATEPDVGRVANGISRRVDRLKCLGNAVVPQQAYPIFKAIAEIEGSKKKRAQRSP